MAELRGIKIPPEVIGLVSGSILRKHKVLPIGFDEKDQNTLILAVADPLDMVAQDDIAIITGRRVEPRVATVGAINSVLDRYFGTGEAMSAAEQYTKEREQQLRHGRDRPADRKRAELGAYRPACEDHDRAGGQQRASDIHIEPLEKKVRVRYRIDGILTEKMMYTPRCCRPLSRASRFSGAWIFLKKEAPGRPDHHRR
jgi:type IV pilus assembly protein PilB